MSGIVFLRHVWRQKAAELSTCNHLPNFQMMSGVTLQCCGRGSFFQLLLFCSSKVPQITFPNVENMTFFFCKIK